MQTQETHKTTLVSIDDIKKFQEMVWDFYRLNRRDFEWRENINPYRVVVSEIMLQQTQTERVKYKFAQWMSLFPTLHDLARATSHDVLVAWQGLGYNRRGLALHAIANKVINEHDGIIPENPDILVTFPGIGKATASSICAFAFNKPTVFIETNIRAVFIHTFFNNDCDVSDKDLIPLIAQAVDSTAPRDWYYALMDYGVMLKKNFKNPSRKSKHHTKQSKFEGSERQIRGMIIKFLTNHKQATFDDFCSAIDRDPERIKKNITNLVAENILKKNGDYYQI